MSLSLHPNSILDVLNDVVTHVHIDSAFQVQHSRYQPLNLPEAVVNRYRQLPQALQRRYQCQKLRDYLYDIYFSHEQDLATDDDQTDQTDSTPLQNDSIRGINRSFYEQIQNANQGEGYFDLGWQIIAVSPTHLMVQKQGLTVQIDPDYHLSTADRVAQIGEMVAVRLPKHRLESGFYVAVSNTGLVPEAPSFEIYFNVKATGAVPLMHYLTQTLNERQIAFTLKLLYEPTDYRRYDAGTLCLERQHYSEILPLLKTVYQQIQSELSPAVPLLTKPLASGVGLAEVPEAELTDFGLHRCQLLAKGLLAAWESGNETLEQRLSYVHQQFAQNQVDLQLPYLNPDSLDIYPPLD